MNDRSDAAAFTQSSATSSGGGANGIDIEVRNCGGGRAVGFDIAQRSARNQDRH
jgi:hypothetical protein